MSFWSAFPFVRLTLALIGGILMAYYNLVDSSVAIWCFVLGFLSYLILILGLPLPAYYQASPYIGLLGLSCICLLGYFCLWSHQVHDPQHISHQQTPIEAYVGVVQESIQEKDRYLSVVVSLQTARIQARWQPIKGKVKLHIRKPLSESFTYGDILMLLGQPQPIEGPLNPQEFDLRAYLSHQNTYHRQVVQPNGLSKMAHAPPNSLQAVLLQFRHYTKSLLTQAIHHSREQGMVVALVLGAKDELDDLLKTAYTAAGTMHVLAVSGLHVGIVYWLLNILLSWLGKGRWSGWMKFVISLAGLWLYAGMTGLAPSVLRATVMFTLVAMGNLLHRKSNIYNVLASSAFLLLLFDPYLIFAVGFQLSYLAVLGIVYLQPKICRLFQFDHKLFKYLWLGSSISLAAQIATTLLSCYYFHQFPVYFLGANWVVVPAAFIILGLGLSIVITGWWQWLSACIAWLLEYITWWVNEFVLWMSSLPFSVISSIYLDKARLLLGYGLLIWFLIFLQRKRFYDLVITCLFAFVIGMASMKSLWQHQIQKGIIFYSIKSHTVIGFIKGMHSWLLIDKPWSDYDKQYIYHIQPSQLAMGIHKSVCYTDADAVNQPDFTWRVWQGLKIGVWDHKRMIILDKASLSCLERLPPITTDFLVVEQDALQELRPLLAKFAFHTLILGSSNSKKLALKLKQEADQLQLASHSLQHQGAYTAFW
jgi:competence protein ComEC